MRAGLEKLGKAVLLELLAIWLPCMIFWFHTENSRGIRDYHPADELRIQVENRQMSVENFLIYMMSVDCSWIREEETLKALAVAARSRLYAHLNEYNRVGNNAERTENSTEGTGNSAERTGNSTEGTGNSTEGTENSTEGGAENNRVIKAEALGVEYESPGEMVHSLEKASGIKHWSEAYQSIKTAVKKTEGRCLTFAKNRAADVMWHRISPGMTRYYKGNLTGKSDGISVCCPELKSMDAQDKMLPEAVNTVIYDRRLLAELLWEIPGTEQILEESQPLSSFFQVEKRDKTGYIEEITVGNRKMTGEEAAVLLKVASGCFYVSDLGSGIKLLVYGDGTGYGMSLAGADEMAGKGADYQEILEYYFPVCKIE